MTTPLDPEALAASDPRTPPSELTRIANFRPDLHGAIYANPSTHLELKRWIETYYPEAVRRAAVYGTLAASPAILQGGPPSVGGRSGVPGQQPEGRRRTAAWIALGVTASLLIAGSIYGVFFLRSDDSAQPIPSTTHTAPAESPDPAGTSDDDVASAEHSDYTESTAPSPTEDSASLGPRMPAPAPRTPSSQPEPVRGQSYKLVDSDSTNFSCEIYSDWVGCSILERSYSDNGQSDCSDRLFSLSSRAGTAGKACGQQFLGKQGDLVTELSIGDSVTYGNTQCELTWEGGLETVTCSNLDGRVLFSLNSARYSFG